MKSEPDKRAAGPPSLWPAMTRILPLLPPTARADPGRPIRLWRLHLNQLANFLSDGNWVRLNRILDWPLVRLSRDDRLALEHGEYAYGEPRNLRLAAALSELARLMRSFLVGIPNGCLWASSAGLQAEGGTEPHLWLPLYYPVDCLADRAGIRRSTGQAIWSAVLTSVADGPLVIGNLEIEKIPYRSVRLRLRPPETPPP